MAPTQSKPQERSTTRNGIKLIKPPIGLERPKQESGKYSEKIKCRTNPADASSTTYEIPMEYFKEGTPEEWLIFQDKLGRCITGQNATSGVAKFALTRRLLDGQAKTAFENAARVQNAHTNATFQACLMAVTEDVFPPKSLLNQKRYMRRFLRKPVEMTAKDYIARVCEINSYLTAFPTEPGRQATKLPTDELLDLLEFGVPLRWQRAMHLHGFEPQEGNIKSFATFCERLESSLDEPALKKQGSSNNETNKKTTDNDSSNGKKKRRRGTGKGNGKGDDDKPFFCLIHGKNTSHNSDQCRTLQKDAEKHKDDRKKNGAKNQRAHKNELHAIVEFAKQAMNSAKKTDTTEELNNFDDLSISTTGMHSE